MATSTAAATVQTADLAAAAAGYGADRAEMEAWLVDGERRALALGNRGPLRFGADGRLAPDILDAYREVGFYVFEGVLGADELADLDADVRDILDRLPASRGAEVDAKGRPALAVGCKAPTLFWSKPLGDPFGGTDLANGRHPVKITEPTPDADAPREIVYLILGALQFSDAFLRLYGHPGLLAAAASVNGPDFTPFNDGIFIKEPGRGASVAWHQDGTTHWGTPAWDPECHGFNFMGQLHGCNPANAVWVVPGSHRGGRVDIRARVAEAGSERLPDAVPMVCGAGDVVINNRQVLHGSFANTSSEWRVTFNFGFHRRASVLGVKGGGVHNAPAVYDEERIRQRSRLIGYAIDARRRRFPDETPYVYEPFKRSGERWEWNEEAKAGLIDYNLLDLSI